FQIIVDFNEVIITLIRYVMYLAPLVIFALVASTISHLGLQIILRLVKYLLVYGLGTILFLAIWILVITLYCKVSPLRL
ncbi:cation:dicarboxylate symporter family transporter, partial [Enterococcus faecalis]|uniref:cation:dicarboxylate symporter family transporter n=1 Tax=Enterococcus faecalis TaxID=1351 RepID=UPI003D6B4FC4